MSSTVRAVMIVLAMASGLSPYAWGQSRGRTFPSGRDRRSGMAPGAAGARAEAHRLPAIAAALVVDGKVLVASAVGFRKIDVAGARAAQRRIPPGLARQADERDDVRPDGRSGRAPLGHDDGRDVPRAHGADAARLSERDGGTAPEPYRRLPLPAGDDRARDRQQVQHGEGPPVRVRQGGGGGPARRAPRDEGYLLGRGDRRGQCGRCARPSSRTRA